MKVVILAGGRGTRIGEETKYRPKPLVEIHGKPIIWHIMKHYSDYGFCEFVICCGYKGHMIKEYFVNYFMQQNNVQFSLGSGETRILDNVVPDWKVTLVDTGLDTLTAGRILKVQNYLGNEPFLLTYGDGVSDIDLNELIKYHKDNPSIVTISATKPEGRFGILQMDETTHTVSGFREKARDDQGWVNMGFMVVEPEIFPYLGDGTEMLEKGPFEKLARDGKMNAYLHEGFWSPMDSLRDKEYLEMRMSDIEGL